MPEETNSGDVVCRVGAHDWTFRRTPGRQIVHGQELHAHVDESDHTVTIADNGNPEDLFSTTIEAMAHVVAIEHPLVGAFGGDIEPTSLGGSVPLLPDDPSGGD